MGSRREVEIRVGDRALAAQIDEDGTVVVDGRAFAVTRLDEGLYLVRDTDRQWRIAVAGTPEDVWLSVDGHAIRVEMGTRGRARARHTMSGLETSAPMPATVIKVLVEPGSSVRVGETLVMLEAMKMELPIRAPRDGVVRAVTCRAGELVQPGVNLVELE
ncbi:MAG TPA: biotin/lipoyl-containing protein [Vicinamibacterales bacterium]|nr:biotin/lipoyl-containing protein [Vicinamibacterales bacterium]